MSFLGSIAVFRLLQPWVLALGILLLEDRDIHWFLARLPLGRRSPTADEARPPEAADSRAWRGALRVLRLAGTTVALSLVAYATTAQLLWMLSPRLPLPVAPVQWLQPFRIANSYGLFAVMTRARYEIEFQGSDDGSNWTPYPFRYKPQDVTKPPGIYAPYQPRFDWNLWFASLGNWRDNLFVVRTEELLLLNDAAVLSLFAGNPFARQPPRQMRAVVWQYWFTDLATKRSSGRWWRREFLGLYAPAVARLPDGSFAVTASPGNAPVP
jgi:hypothetical protein